MVKTEIAVFQPSLNPAGGGETVSLHLIKTLLELDYNVTLVTIEKTNWDRLSQVLDQEKPQIYEQYTFKKLPDLFFPFLTSLLVTFLFISKLIWYKYLRSEYDLLINTCGEKINSISDLVYFNAIPLRCAYKISSTSRSRKILSRLYDLMLSSLDGVNPCNTLIANSEFNKRLITDTIHRSSVVIYPPINFQRIKSSSTQKTDSVVIVTRFLPEQNLELIPELVVKTPGVEYTLIGPTSKQSEPVLKKLRSFFMEYGVSGRVNLFLNESYNFYTSRLEKAKIVLRPLPSEPFGISILEAMYLGCIPIVHRSSGPWEDILEGTQGRYGYSFTGLDELSMIIKHLMKNKGLVDVLSQRVKNKALEFQDRVFYDEVSQVVNNLIKD